MNEFLAWSPIVIALLTLVGVVLKSVWDGRHGKTARREPTWNEVVTENRNLRTDLTTLEGNFDEFRDSAEGKIRTLKGQVSTLEVDRKLSDRREVLLYFHTKALRDHIIDEKPPPPPAAHPELIEWFENFEDTAGSA